MTHKDNYSLHHRGATIKCQKSKWKKHSYCKRHWVEAQVTMPDKSFIYVQAEPTKIALLRETRRKIDSVLYSANLWRRWATGEMECRPLPLPHNEFV